MPCTRLNLLPASLEPLEWGGDSISSCPTLPTTPWLRWSHFGTAVEIRLSCSAGRNLWAQVVSMRTRGKFGEGDTAPKPKHKKVVDAIKKKTQEQSTDPVVPSTPVTDETFAELTKFIRGKADEVKKHGTTVRNKVILQLKKSLHETIQFSLPSGVPLEEVQINDIRPQLDEDQVKKWILSEDIPF